MSEITPVISATGLYTPPETISNDELVASFNAYVKKFNLSGQVDGVYKSSLELKVTGAVTWA